METKRTQRSKKPLLITVACLVAAAIILGVVLFLTQCTGVFYTPNSEKLAKQLASEETLTITVDEDIILDAPLVVNGNKTIIGTGKIMLKTELEGSWPESNKPSWGMGCATLEAQDASAMPAALQVSAGATLNLGGSVTVDAEGNANGILLADGTALKLSEGAVVKNGRYATLVVPQGANVTIDGGELSGGSVFNVLNHGTLNVTGGLVSGAKSGANIYSDGTVAQSGGTVSLSGLHNVYVAGGTFTMTGGVNDSAAKDGIVVKENAKADITGGDISNCIHGICNDGETNAGEVLLSECGIMNSGTGKLDIKGTTVDTSEVYCLANNGGKVNAENFTAKKCDTIAVYNFSGDMVLKNITVTGGRDGNISNASGTMTVEGGILDHCRDKSVVVGNGNVVLNNVKINGTSNEKYGVYIFGGELYINDSSIENIDSTAVKADPGSYVELNNVTIKEIAQNGFQTDGGRVVINNVTLENAKSHGIYNKGGEVIVNKMQITGVRKNAVQHYAGTTTISGLTAQDMGNHGAYVADGTLTVKDSSFKNMTANGVYIIKSDNKLVMENVTIADAGQQGINNNSIAELKNITITNTGKNGIYNRVGGTMTIDGLTVSDTAEHGVNNKSQMTASNVTVVNSGNDSNGVQNNGTLVLNVASITDTKNHGLYNNGVLTATDVTVNGTTDNGIYNDKGEVTITNLTVSKTGGQGVNNNSVITLINVKISDAGKNGIYNSAGTAKIKKLTVTNTTEHGVNNAATMELNGADISATGKGSNGVQNKGTLTLTSVTIKDSKNHGIYNSSKLTATTVTISGAADNGIYNDGGNATISGLTVTDVKGQGVNNNASITLKNVKISKTGKNGIYNAAGIAKIEKLTVSNTTEHGVNNAATMELNGADISATGKGSNGVQNKGTLTLTAANVKNSENHGIYNGGKLTATTVTVSGAADNGIYNDGGNATISGLTVTDVKGQGVNNNATITLTDVKISETGKNGIYNSAGTANVSDLTVSNTTEHGVNNAATMELSSVEISATGVDKNGIQNTGKLNVSTISVTDSKNHGIYNNGTLSGNAVTVTNVGNNGIYNDGGKVKELTDLTVSGTVEQGINNNGDFTATNVTISGTGKNGVYNNGGTAVITNLAVTNPGEHGVNNKGTATLVCAVLDGSAYGSNCVQNNGDLTLENVTLNNSSNHGIYNDSKLVSNGVLVVNNAAVNGIYNYGGEVNIERADITGSGEHGVNNVGTLTAETLVIEGVTANGIQNQGTMTVTGAAHITNSGKHGIYNGGTFEGTNLEITNAGDLLLNNGGKRMVIRNVILSGTAHKAIYNSGYAEMYNMTVDGTQVRNESAEYLIDNNGGVLDLTDTTIYNAYGVAIQNRGKGAVSVTNVAIDLVGNYGIFIEGGSKLSGDGLAINHVTKGFDGAEGYAIKNQGTITMMDHVTLGGYGQVSGNGIPTVSDESPGLVSTGLTNDADSSTYSGKGLTILGASDNAIYNKGKLYVTDLFISDSKNGIVCRYNGWATLSGENQILNSSANPIRTFGKDDDKNGATYSNGVTLPGGASLHIDGAGSHAINNKGTFEAAADSTLTIRNVVGTNINAINNNGGTMKLGDVTIDGVYVTVTMYNDTTINSNSGNGIQTNSSLEINGKVVISNLFLSAANGKTDNSNGTGIVVKNGGKITGTGSVEIIGSQTAPEGYEGYTGLFNGIFTTKCTIDIDGDISVSGAKNQGIYVADANAKVEANNITVSSVVSGNGIYVNNKDGKLTASGNVEVSGTGQNGICNAGKFHVGGNIYVHDITSGHNGLRNDGSGNMTVAGHVTIENISGTTTSTGRGNALTSNGKVTIAGNLTISGVTTSGNTDNTSNNAINGSGTITVGGNVTVTDAVAAGHGVFLDQGRLYVTGNIEINSTGKGKQGIYGANETKDSSGNVTKTAEITAANITIRDAGGNGIYINKTSNKVTVTSNITISGTKDGHGLSTTGTVTCANLTVTDTLGSNRNGVEAKSGCVLNVSGAITITGSGQRGLNNAGTVTADSLTVDGFGENGIQNGGTLNVTGAITVSNCTKKGHGIYNGKTLTAGSFTVSNVVRNGINNGGSFTVTGTVTVNNAGEGGIGSNKTFSAGSVVIDTVTAGPGINNSGTFTVTGLTSVKNITCTDANAIQNKNTMTLGDVEVDGVYTTVGVDGDGKQKTYVGNGLYNEKNLTLKGTVTITNVFTEEKNNSLGAGFSQAATGTTTGTGSLVITGTTVTNDAYPYSINNGIFLDASTINLAGDITVSNVLTQGIYVANENASLTANNITVNGAKGNGIYVNKTTGSLTATGAVSVTATGQHGINNVGTIAADSITVNNACPTGTNNGINNNGGTVTVTGAVAVNGVGGHGVSNNKNFTASSVTVINAGKNGGNGIQNSGSGNMTISGAVNISNVINGHAIYNAKTVSFGSFTSVDTSKNGINNGGTFTVTGELSVTNAGGDAIANSNTLKSGSITVDTGVKTGINNSGTFTVTGLTTVKTITGTDINAIHNKNTMTLGDVVIDGIKVKVGTQTTVIDGVETTSDKTNVGNGIYNEKTLVLNGTANITNVFTDKKGNTVGAGFCQAATGTTTGTGSLIITGTASSDEAYPYGINNGIFLDGSSLNLSGDITVSNVTNQGIYVANENAALTAKNITVTDVAGNGIYVNKVTGALTTTGTITVKNAALHGINNVGTMNTGAIVLENITKNGINNSGTVTIAAGDVTATNIGDTGIASNGAFNAPNTTLTVNTVKNQGVSIKAEMNVLGITVTNSNGHGVVVNNKDTTMTVTGTIRVDGFTKRGISNTQAGGEIKAGNIVVTNGTSANIDAGIKNGNATAKITVTGDLTVSNVGGTTTAKDVGNGITNTGTITVGGTLKVMNTTSGTSNQDTANCGIWNKGTIKAAALIVDGVANRAGIYLNGGMLEVTDLTVQNVQNYVGIFIDSSATLKATTATVSNINHQGIQANHANTIEIGTLTVTNIAKNGLRLYNNSSNPTVAIVTVVGNEVKENVVAAAKALTTDNVTIGTVWHQNCGTAVHTNLTSCVGKVKNELPAEVSSAAESGN